MKWLSSNVVKNKIPPGGIAIDNDSETQNDLQSTTPQLKSNNDFEGMTDTLLSKNQTVTDD